MNPRLLELVSAAGEDAGEYLESALVELLQSRVRHTDWPLDPVHASAILSEEAAKIVAASQDFYSRSAGTAPMEDACVRTAAMCLRFLMHLGEYVQINK